MPPLAELQRNMARAVLGGDGWASAPRLADGPVPAKAAFEVHCDTVHATLANALRITFPTVDTLVGEVFFNQAARAYAAWRPPRRARLSDYGDAFAAFLEAYGPAADLAYLGDVSRLDWTIGLALRTADAGARRHLAIEPGIGLTLPVSLTVLSLRFPADLIRAALDDGDDEALSRIDLAPGPRNVAIWRAGRSAAVQPLSLPAGRFLGALLGGQGPDVALDQACAGADPQTALLAIQTEVFAARFAQIMTTPSPDPIP